MSTDNEDSDTNNSEAQHLDEKIRQHMSATRRTSDEIVFVRSENGEGDGGSSRSASGQITQQKHTDKHKVSTRAEHERNHNKETDSGHLKPLPHIAPAPQLKPSGDAPKPPKPPQAPQLPKPPIAKPLGSKRIPKPKM